MSRITRISSTLLLVGTLAVGAVTLGGGPATGKEGGAPTTAASLAEVRRATVQYHDVDVALADGYVPVSPCEALPGVGGMGIHYLHPQLASDLDVIADRPELLLYEPRADGSLQLVGVEWFVADAGQARPEVNGVSFDGPMAGHSPDMPVHYDLHAWIWKANPDGVFAAWNPNVVCPAHEGEVHDH